MAEPALKLAPQPDAAAPQTKPSFLQRSRRRIRLLLLVVVPAVVLMLGVGLYLSGGRYISTDNAYVGAQKVLITPDISGKVQRVLVREGQHVGVNDALFEIDPVPFQLALRQAQSKLDSIRTDFANLKSNYRSLSHLVELGKEATELRRRDVDRKASLAANKAGTQLDLDSPHRGVAASTRATAAQQHAESASRQSRSADRAVSSLSSSKGGFRSNHARSRPHGGEIADLRNCNPGRQHPAWSIRDRRHAGVQRHRRFCSLG
jgi:multidrug resistance efflux pump